MIKTFFVLNVIEGKPGVLRERETFDEAVDCATSLVLEQHEFDIPEDQTKEEFEKKVREELSNDYDWWRKGGDIAIYILQTEDD
jgi:hypothetical protein